MLDTKIITQDSNNGQQPTKGTIKYRIRFLCATYGDCLNLWPKYAQVEYFELARQLRQIEGMQK